jgi:hypothetical protein
MLPEGDGRLAQSRYLADNAESWMSDAKRIAVVGHRSVLEDGPDVCNSESEAKYSDHGEQWTDAEIYTPDMLGPDGKPRLSLARLTTEQAKALRASRRATNDGRAGGQGTVVDAG